MKLIVADADPLARAATRRALEAANLNAQIDETEDCASTLDALRGCEYDGAFIELNFPDGDGLTLLLKARACGVLTPIIALTGQGDEAVAVELMKAGASDYLAKSRMTPENLGRMTRAVVRLRRAEAQARSAQQALRESEARFRIIADSAPVLIWMAGVDANPTYFNQRWFDFRGRTMAEEEGEGWAEGVHPDDLAHCQQVYHDAFAARQNYQMEYRLRRSDGQYRWLLSTGVPRYGAEGEFAGYVGSSVDITERKEAEQALRTNQAQIALLNERLQSAMTETHHRVKNNLQIIASMVDMKAMEDDRALTAKDFKQLGMHIHMLAIVHDLLTQQAKQDGVAASVSAKAILEKLLPVLQHMAPGRALQTSIDEAEVSARQGTSLAIVVNELVSNALKHGQGAVGVTLRLQDKRAILTVTDDGPGFPPDFNPRRAAHTGLELVESLSRWDLGGQVHFGNGPDGGGCVTVAIPLACP